MSCASLDDLPAPPKEETGWPWTEQTDPLPETQPSGEPWPKISIVTPSYNQGRFLEETIRSILLQGYPNLEYIVIDGGSTDESEDVIKKYEPWIEYWVSEDDRGQTHAINKGLEQCTGDVFNWVNSDDYLARGALSVVGERFAASTPPEVLCGYNRRFDSETGKTVKYVRLFLSETPGRSVAKHRFIQTSTYYRMDVVQSLGPFDEDLHYNMDKEYFIRYILQRGQKYVSFTDEVLSHFRLHDSSKTVSESKEHEDGKIEVYEQVLRALSIGSPLHTERDGKMKKVERWKPKSVNRRKAIGSICIYLARKYATRGDFVLYRHWLTCRAIWAEPWRQAARYRYIVGAILYPELYQKLKRKTFLSSISNDSVSDEWK
ncbi:glycosyltransferase involved in cell wall biosynthesis [Salinibacter ruber]|uniref:glycosyltransferase family 2 protein n=1 Tax=Salinibacter ruber TaxID=146919 RepID=UPI0021673F6F|nr:glycosyltransferase family 2 protein [Salinibacter ruber]MCS3863263.1 glycosyltransferase involved in cell wall biosynthesis [Salinibacter ruber]